ncbi:MAG: DUF1494 domain-containing protein [Candidatus Algichlamydia australiensis]|nr:DUF1494 domain-containing protein [Chlamydiales bacterium]
MKRRAFTLVEIIIAFGLLALITTTLFTTFRRQALLKAELTRAERSVLQRKYFSERFSQIFSSLALQEPFYLDEEQALHFVFDNGIDPERAFCHHVHGKIFLKKKRLLLEISSLDRKESREELLFEKVNEVAYRFISFPPKNDEMGQEIVPTSWPKEESAPPRLMRLSLKFKDDEVNYAFSLNPSKISYVR